MSGALAGLRVIDCSRLIAGGVLATILADHGADVVKVENPRGGDPLRTWLKERGELWWKVYARGKRSITLNLAHPRGQALLTRLVRDADVLIENFVPGTLEKWGLGWDVLSAENPRLVLARVSGWGQDGPYRDRPGFGTMVEAMSGFAAATGPADGPPTLPSFPMAHGRRARGGRGGARGAASSRSRLRSWASHRPLPLRATALPPRAHRRRVRARRHDPDTPRQPVRQREPPRHLPDARRQVDRALGLDARLGQGPVRRARPRRPARG